MKWFWRVYIRKRVAGARVRPKMSITVCMNALFGCNNININTSTLSILLHKTRLGAKFEVIFRPDSFYQISNDRYHLLTYSKVIFSQLCHLKCQDLSSLDLARIAKMLKLKKTTEHYHTIRQLDGELEICICVKRNINHSGSNYSNVKRSIFI